MDLKKESRRKWVMGKISGKFHMKRKPMSNFIKFSMSFPPPSIFFPRGLMEEDRPQNTFIYPSIRGRTKQRIDHSMLWHPEDLSVASLYSWNLKKPHVLHQELATTSIQKTWIRLPKKPNTLNNHSTSSFQTCCQEMNGFFLVLRQMGRWKIPKHVLLVAMFSISWKAHVSKSQ